MPIIDLSPEGKEKARDKAKQNDASEKEKRKRAVADSRKEKSGAFGRLFTGGK
jgi:hypothetical protein